MPTDAATIPSPSRAPALAALVVGSVLAAPVLFLRYPPMGDLPFHESLVALLRHHGDPSFAPPGLYALSLGIPNQLFHLVAAALSLAMDTDVACKLLVAACVVATPLAAVRLARHFEASGWSGMLAAPLALGFAFRWGLVGNVVGLPLLLLALPALERAATEPSRRTTARALLAVGWLYLAHESALAVGVAASGLFSLRALRGSTPARALQLAVPSLLGVSLAVYYAVRSRHLKAPSILAVPDAFGTAPLARAAEIPRVLFGSLDAWQLWAVFGLYALAFLPFVVAKLEATRELRPGGAPLGAALPRSHHLAVLAAACFVAYEAVPVAWSGSTLLYQRFLPMGVALLAVVVAPPGGREWLRPVALVLPPCAALATLFVALPAFGDADRRFRELDVVLGAVARDSAVAQLDLTPAAPGAVAPIPGAGARALAERGGRLLFSFADAPTSPVTIPPRLQWNEPVLRLVRDPFAFSPPHDFGRFRYALVRLDPEASVLAPVLVSVMAPEGQLIKASGEWMLFQSTLEVAPLTAPDARLAVPPVDTVRRRLAALRKEQPPEAGDPGTLTR